MTGSIRALSEWLLRLSLTAQAGQVGPLWRRTTVSFSRMVHRTRLSALNRLLSGFGEAVVGVAVILQ